MHISRRTLLKGTVSTLGASVALSCPVSSFASTTAPASFVKDVLDAISEIYDFKIMPPLPAHKLGDSDAKSLAELYTEETEETEENEGSEKFQFPEGALIIDWNPEPASSTRTRTRSLTRTRTRTRTRIRMRTRTRTRTRTRAAGEFVPATAADILAPMAVVDEKFRKRLLENFHIIESVLDKPIVKVGSVPLDPEESAEKAAEYETFKILRPPHEQQLNPVGLSRAEEIDMLLEMQQEREKGGPEVETRLEMVDEEVDDIISRFTESFTNEAGAPFSVVHLLGLMELAGHSIVAHYKDLYKRPRPHVVDSRIDPAIDVPNHDSYPSGHSLQAHLMAAALGEVMGDKGAQVSEFHDIADQIAANREFAGVHYPSDSAAGQIMATAIFPILRVLFDEVFLAATRDMNESPEPGCNFRLENRKVVLADPDWERRQKIKSVPWHKQVMSMEEDSDFPGYFALVDTAIDLDHPGLLNNLEALSTYNADYPIPVRDKGAMSSIGTGHGTSMAGIMVGHEATTDDEAKVPIVPFKGIAPNGNLMVSRITSFLSDSHENRMAIAGALLDTFFLIEGVTPRAITLVPPIARPDPSVFSTLDPDHPMRPRWLTLSDDRLYLELSEAFDLENEPPCDILILTLMMLSRFRPVVLPAGNNGFGELGYPGNPKDYSAVTKVLNDRIGRLLCVRMIENLLFKVDPGTPKDTRSSDEKGPTEFNKEIRRQMIALMGELARNFSRTLWGMGSQPLDLFEGTGIIVVGAGTVPLEVKKEEGKDPVLLYEGNPIGDPSLVPPILKRSNYSQFGPGLCLLAPSDMELPGYEDCTPIKGPRPLAVPTTDILGPGGFADSPYRLYSSTAQREGFGGTSAAAAQVCAIMGFLEEDVDGPTARRLLVQAVSRRAADFGEIYGERWTPERGYGQATVRGLN